MELVEKMIKNSKTVGLTDKRKRKAMKQWLFSNWFRKHYREVVGKYGAFIETNCKRRCTGNG